MLVSVFFVSAFDTVEVRPNKFAEETFKMTKVPVHYKEGWNIIPLSTTYFSIYDGEDYNDPAAMQQWRRSWKFMYLPLSNNYIGFRDLGDEVKFSGVADLNELQREMHNNYNSEMLMNLAGHWAYFTEDIIVNHYVEPNRLEDAPNANYKAGWNFIVVPIEMSTGEYGFGDCDFDKIFHWDTNAQNWAAKNTEQMKNMVGQGFAVHTENACSLGNEGAGAPPAIPN